MDDTITEYDCNTENLSELPSKIENFINLQILDCSYNNITELPFEIGKLVKIGRAHV